MNRPNINSLDELIKYSAGAIKSNLKLNNQKAELLFLAINVDYNERVSNAHNCPIGGVTNWGYKEDKPRGYPGWKGRVWCIYSDRPESFGSDYLKNTLLHTGAGGYGSYDLSAAKFEYYHREYCYGKYKRVQPFSWDLKIFLDDLPGILMQDLLLNNNSKYSYERQYEV